jgi:adenosine deaminase
MIDLTTPSGLAGPPLRRLIEAMPKAELHLHLDGSLRVDTAMELARTRGIDAPTSWAEMSAALIAPMPCASQAELLRAFDLPIALMQDAEALERITAELVETKAADGVRYIEIRWGPLLHVMGGLALVDGIGAVCAGARDAAFRTGTVVRLICTALRSHDPAANEDLARVAVDDDGDAGILAVAFFGRQLQGGLDAREDDLAVDVLLVVHLVHDPEQVGAFHVSCPHRHPLVRV